MDLLDRILKRRRRPPVPVTMYVRRDCHLCDEMKAELARAGLRGRYELTVLDLDTDVDEAVRADHGPWVPVMEIGGRVAFKARMDAATFRKRFAKLAERWYAEQGEG